MTGVVCATAENSGLLKKSSAVKLKASDYVGLPNNAYRLHVYCIR